MKSKNKFHGIMEKSDINTNLIDINDLSSLLIKSGYMEKFSFTEEQLDILNLSNIYYQILSENLEFNDAITSEEVSKKYGRVISSINTTFNIKVSFKELFRQYIYYTKANITINIFMNYLIILDIIITNFKNILYDSFNNLLENSINFFNINTVYENYYDDNQNLDRLSTIRQSIKKFPQYFNKKVEGDLIIIVYLLSLENKIIFNRQITNHNNIINILDLYNKIYISDTSIALLIYIEIIIITNIRLYFNKKKKISFEHPKRDKTPSNTSKKNVTNKRKSSFNDINEVNNINYIKNEIPNFVLFDDEIKYFKDINEFSIKVFIFQNCLKLYLLYHLSKNKFKFKMNLSVQNIRELMNKLNNYNQRLERKKKKELEQSKLSLGNNGPLAPNNNFEENLKNYVNNNKIKSSRNQLYKSENEKININEIAFKKNIISKPSIFSNITNDQMENINLNNVKIMSKNNIHLSLNNFDIDEILIKFINTMNLNDMKILNSNYFSLITNSTSCYFQESILFFNPEERNNDTETKNNNEINDYSIMITPRVISSKTQILSNTINFEGNNILDNLTIKDFLDQIEILNYFLEFYSRLDSKKIPKIIQLKFNIFKCNINQSNKMIQVFFNFSKIKEKVLFEFLKEVKNMYLFIQNYTTIIKSLKEFKFYQSTIRVSQTNFRSNQLNYLFNLITHKLVDFIEDNNYNKISIYETQLNNYNPNMKIYLKDFSLKKRNMCMNLKLILFKFPLLNKIKFIIEYLAEFVEQWDLIVLSDSDKDIKLLKSFNDNKLFIFLLKEKESNNNKNLISIINNNKNNNNENNNNKKKSKNQASLRRKESDSKNKEYEYLNIIMYIRNSRQDYFSILKTMELFLTNKNLELDFKTNLICDRIFFEENIMNDNKIQNMQLILLNMIDDFFLVTKTFGSINRVPNQNKINNNKITKSVINEHYNYDFFIGDDFVGVLNNRLYDFNSDINNNFSNLIYDFLSVLSSCLELIYFILKIKSIFILRFVYIIHTKDNCYYSLEIKNWNFFIKKMTDFSSLFTANIKISKPLFCLLKKKINVNNAKNIDEAMEDNFYDIFLRLFLNLNKVVKKEELNQEFFIKLHKNIFKDYLYDLVAFSYEAFVIANKFFISNNYLNISKGEKFENCYIIPSQGFFDKKNYSQMLNYFDKNEYDEESNNLIVKNILVFNFGIDFNYIFKNKDKILFGFSKINYFIGKYNNYIFNKILTENKSKKDLLKKKFETKKTDKKNINKYLKLIEQFQLGNYYQDEHDEQDNNNKNINIENKSKIVVYNTSIKLYNSIIEDYTQQKILAQTQKNELNLFKNEEKSNTEKQTINFEEEDVNIHRECNIY